MQSLNQQCLSHQSLDVDDIFLNLYLIKFDVDNFNFNLFYENLDYDNWSNRFISNKSDYWVLRCFQKYSQCNTYSLCQHLSKNIFGPEDMQKLNSTTIIVGSGDYHKLDSQEQAPKVVKLGIKNFPNDISQYMESIFMQLVLHIKMKEKVWKSSKYQMNTSIFSIDIQSQWMANTIEYQMI
ncbi:unnamed protein product (macronuclear) [Paramecium tetraurelia]|uniref:Uncharacterized protein n=1 Tax=Paramecium tetraurelia TaxID=5888 RepID=A0CLT8_PARTE|nr:uncharacterized protein GSPATT00038680001 [Paramecium tetraurelia]CAK71755.1 unnamed protein product [Paramecium tetraurelia]|eukprot:XP_001439152.1 hypothetical protein (macronuclear) [Paramecium tetraurelia strain d4-2]